MPEDEQESTAGASRGTSSIIESIKRKTSLNADSDGVINDPTEGAPVGKIRANVESSKLRQILNTQFGDEDE